MNGWAAPHPSCSLDCLPLGGRLAMLDRTGPCSPDHSSDTDLQSQSQPEEEEEAEEDEGEELGHTETYADYVPSKCECPALHETPAGWGGGAGISGFLEGLGSCGLTLGALL